MQTSDASIQNSDISQLPELRGRILGKAVAPTSFKRATGPLHRISYSHRADHFFRTCL
jgi:hypothetical protein